MRHGFVLLLFFGGCILEGPTIGWLGRPRLFQGPSGSDVIQLDVAVLEGPVANRAFNQDLWGTADEQEIAPETQTLLAENGLRVGQIGGLAPQDLQTLLTSERSCARSRRIQLRSGSTRPVVLGPAVAQCRFVLHENGHDVPVTLEKGTCILSVIPTLADNGRVRLQFTPEIQTGSAHPLHPAADRSPVTTRRSPLATGGDQQEHRPTESYTSLSWDITLAPNDYLLIGARYDRPNTLGWQCFIRPEEDPPVQRLLVIRTTRSTPSVENEIAPSSTARPPSFAQSPSLAAQASGAGLHGNGP